MYIMGPRLTWIAMSTTAEIIEGIQSTLLEHPYTSHSTTVPPEYLSLFYLDKKGVSHHLVLNKHVTIAQLDGLVDACDPATFGRGNQDVMDESYRKAGKLDTTKFSCPFDLNTSGLLRSSLTDLMKDGGLNRPVKAELYKLNIYGQGSFFKAHTDTPRSDSMFASIVVAFPVPHEGGGLSLTPGGKKDPWIYDSSTLSSESSPNTMGCVAFFSDVEHEVLPVTSGHRITLTYNIFYDDSDPPSLVPSSRSTQLDFVDKGISNLLSQPTFLPTGGVLGFGLQYSYPIEPGKTNLKDIQRHLKGSDTVIESIFCNKEELSNFRLAAVLEDNEFGFEDRFLILEEDIATDIDKWNGDDETFMWSLYRCRESFQAVHDASLGANLRPSYMFAPSQKKIISWPITWVSPQVSEYGNYKNSFATHGNELTLEWVYVNLCLVAYVGPWNDRKNVEAIEGVPVLWK